MAWPLTKLPVTAATDIVRSSMTPRTESPFKAIVKTATEKKMTGECPMIWILAKLSIKQQPKHTPPSVCPSHSAFQSCQ